MGDLTLRLVVIATVGVAVAVFAFVLRKVRTRPRRIIPSTGLAPGVYLLTSAACVECSQARAKLSDMLGREGFTELPWEAQSQTYQRLGITAVPSTLLVAPDGSGVWHAGVPRNP